MEQVVELGLDYERDFLSREGSDVSFFSLVGCGILQRNVFCVTCILKDLSLAREYSVDITAQRVEVDSLKRKSTPTLGLHNLGFSFLYRRTHQKGT